MKFIDPNTIYLDSFADCCSFFILITSMLTNQRRPIIRSLGIFFSHYYLLCQIAFQLSSNNISSSKLVLIKLDTCECSRWWSFSEWPSLIDHRAVALDNFNYKLPYASYFGDDSAHNPSDYVDANGYSIESKSKSCRGHRLNLLSEIQNRFIVKGFR